MVQKRENTLYMVKKQIEVKRHDHQQSEQHDNKGQAIIGPASEKPLYDEDAANIVEKVP